MNEQNEKNISHGHEIEQTSIGEVPFVADVPKDGDRLIIGAKPRAEDEAPESGLEIISLADYPKDVQGNTIYGNSLIAPDVVAMLIDPLEDNSELTKNAGYKGLRRGESIDSKRLSTRFGKEVGFTVAMDQDGTLLIENVDVSKKLDALQIRPAQEAVEVEVPDAASIARKIMDMEDAERTVPRVEGEAVSLEAAEAHAELIEEAVEDLGETATEEAFETFDAEKDVVQEVSALKNEAPSEIDAQLSQLKQEYERQTRTLFEGIASEHTPLLAGASNDIDEVRGRLLVAKQDIDTVAGTLRQLQGRIESGDDVPVARLLGDYIPQVAQIMNIFRQNAEQAADARRKTASAKEGLERDIPTLRTREVAFEGMLHELKTTSETAIDTSYVGTNEEVRSLTEVANELEDAAGALGRGSRAMEEYGNEMQLALTNLDMVAQDARYGRVDTDQLRTVVVKLESVFHDTEGTTAFSSFDGTYEKALRVLRTAAER